MLLGLLLGHLKKLDICRLLHSFVLFGFGLRVLLLLGLLELHLNLFVHLEVCGLICDLALHEVLLLLPTRLPILLLRIVY